MNRTIPNLILNSLQSMYQNEKSNPRHAHRNLCQEMVSNWYKDMKARGDEPSNFDFMDEDGGISLMRSGEANFLVEAIRFEIVRDVFKLFGNPDAMQDEILQFIWKNMEFVPMSVLRKWAFTYIWSSFEDEAKVHPFDRFYVLVGAARVIFILENETTHLKLDYYFHPTGCLIAYNGQKEIIEKFSFDHLAANEFVEIIKYSLGPIPRVPLKIFSIDIDPFYWNGYEISWDPDTYPRVSIFKNIRKWMNLQIYLDDRRLIHAEDFRMKWFRFGDYEDQPFTLEYLKSGVLSRINLQAWDDKAFSRNRFDLNHSFMVHLNRTKQWARAKFIDINDPLVHGFIPNLSGCSNVAMWKLTKAQLRKITRKFQSYPPDLVCSINTTLDFIPSTNVNGTTYSLPLYRENIGRHLLVIISHFGVTFFVNIAFCPKEVLNRSLNSFNHLVKGT